MIKWIGHDLSKRVCWTTTAADYFELYNQLIVKGIINFDEIGPYEIKQLSKVGLTLNDFPSSKEALEKVKELPELTQEEIRLVIYYTDDVAVYQEFIDKEYSPL